MVAPVEKDKEAARALGWAGIGIGMAEIVAPRLLDKVLGVGDHRLLTRSMGIREIVSGLGILSNPKRPTAGLWSRVVGDVVDVALLGATAARTRRPRTVLLALGAVLVMAYLDLKYAKRNSGQR